MKYKGTRIGVKDCDCALKFYSDMFGFQLLQDNDSWGQKVVGFYDPDANLIEVGTPV